MRFPPNRRRHLITHSSVAFVLSRYRQPLSALPAQLASWSEQLGVDCARREVMAGLALALAQRDNPSGGILFSSLVADHVRATCQQARLFDGDSERVGRFDRLVRSHLATAARRE